MAMTRLNGNHFRNGEEQFIDTSGWESIHHGANDAGGCDVPWCTYSTDVEGSEHVNIDRVLNEPGRFNSFKNHETLLRHAQEMRRILLNEFREEVGENADAHLVSTHDLTLMVLRLLKTRAEGRNSKIAAIAQERNELISERSSLMAYVWETFEERAKLLEASGVSNGPSLAIGIMENLRDQLESLTTDKGVKTNPEFASSDYPKGDPMRPEARRNVTLNDLRTTLLGMLLSGCDVALKDLDAYLERYVQAVDSIVRRSIALERSEECHYCEQYGIGRCRQHAPQAGGRR